ncbi:MAG: autotransporter-associated beta strand repeat-containing protein [Kiritimatiellia bacterium]
MTKFGLGTLRLNKANSYSGGTYVWSGTLRIADAGAIGASPLVLGHEGTLDLAGSYTLNNAISGDGRITTGANTLTLGPNGSLSPGFSVGTMTVENLDFRGTLYWEFDATNSTDVVACKTLTFGGSAAKKVYVSWLGTGRAPLGTYTLFTYTGADPTVVPSEWAVLAPPKRVGSVSVDAANKRVVVTLTRLPEGSMLLVR